MRRASALLLLTTAPWLSAGADTARPRGVGPDFAKYYKSKDAFTCISNPSITLSTSQVNDDYCDCPDGSDEPGTSACSYISPLSPPHPQDNESDDVVTTLALPGFYCKNKGHRSSYLPSQNVNDGVCDYDFCCDGSDEWAHVGGIACPDKCKEIGKEWKKFEEERQKAMSTATKKRKELVTEAARLRQEVEDRIKSLGTQIEGSEMKVKILETDLKEVERQERGKVVKKPGKGGKVTILAGLAKDRIEELRDALVDVKSQRDKSKARVKELEEILKTFKTDYNPNFNDEGVKRTVRSWEEYVARDADEEADEASEQDLVEIAKPDSENDGIKWEEWETTDESETDLLYQFEAYLPTPLRRWLDQKLRDLRVILVENGVLAASGDSGSESSALTTARASLKSAEDDLSGLKTQLTNHQDDLAKSHGPDDVFRALKGQCVAKDSGEYTYELCWLEKTKQKSKKGGGETVMGNYVGIETVTVDDELPPDGKGVGSGERVALRYENGQGCWNGPSRSTLVVLGCAEKDEVWKIMEEEKCVYRMEAGTPAVCEGANGGKKEKNGAKDEL